MRFLFAAILAAASGLAAAQDFPTRPIRLFVGFTPGTGIDVVARIVAIEVSKNLPQPVVVENRAGAGGNIAAEAAIKSSNDGYSLHWAAPGSAVINHHLIKSMQYSFKDLVPVSLIGLVPLVVIVPIFILLIPGLRLVPTLYSWRIRRRIYKCYGELMALERDILTQPTPEDNTQFRKRLDEIEEGVNNIKLPLPFADQSYVLREHINFVRGRLGTGAGEGKERAAS